MADADTRLMTRALEIAREGDPSPNPHVGAILADGERVLAERFHEAAGLEHAEGAVLREVGEQAKGKTAQ